MWGQKRADRLRLKDEERERHHFKAQLRYTLGAGELTVALARMAYSEGYTFRHRVQGGPDLDEVRCTFPEEVSPCFYGVVHESSGRMDWENLKKWIQVQMWLPRRRSTPPHVGTMAIEALREGDILNRQLRLSLSIGDETGSVFSGLSTALRDKAGNGDPFLHVVLKVEVEPFEDVLRGLKERHTFACAIRTVSWERDLRLPQAPVWAWRWSYAD